MSDNLNVIFKDARAINAFQIKQLKELISSGIDVL